MYPLIERAILDQISNGTNGAISPTSLALCLGMVHAAGPGNPQIEAAIGNASESAMRRMMELTTPVASINNQLWTKVTPSARLLQVLEDVFGAVVKGDADFSDPRTVTDEINTQVNRATNGMIEEIIVPDMIRHAFAVFLNTLLVKLLWADSFDEDKTQMSSFNGPRGEVDVDMMFRRGYLDLGQAPFGTVVEMPIQQEGAAVRLVLPNEGASAKDVLMGLEQIVSMPLDEEDVDLSLPCVNLEAEFEVIVIDSSDLTELGQPDAPIKGIHRVIFELDEEGVRAAAATAAVGFESVSDPTPVIFDRPFLLVIKAGEGQDALPLFVAWVNNPEG